MGLKQLGWGLLVNDWLSLVSSRAGPRDTGTSRTANDITSAAVRRIRLRVDAGAIADAPALVEAESIRSKVETTTAGASGAGVVGKAVT